MYHQSSTDAEPTAHDRGGVDHRAERGVAVLAEDLGGEREQRDEAEDGEVDPEQGAVDPDQRAERPVVRHPVHADDDEAQPVGEELGQEVLERFAEVLVGDGRDGRGSGRAA